MSDVTDLKAEVLLLRQENKELRADQAHWELGNCPSCPNVADLQEALEQNAKLRELCKDMLAEIVDYDLIGSCRYEARMRELGVTA